MAEVEAIGVEGGGDVLEEESGGVFLGALLLGEHEDDEGPGEEEDDDDDEKDLDEGEGGGLTAPGATERGMEMHTRRDRRQMKPRGYRDEEKRDKIQPSAWRVNFWRRGRAWGGGGALGIVIETRMGRHP